MNKSSVIYDEVEHTYHLNGKQLKGITGTLIPHAIGQKYADVPEHILAEKAKYGKLVHGEIEVFLNGFEPSEPTPEFLAFTSSNEGTEASKVMVPVFVINLSCAKLRLLIKSKAIIILVFIILKFSY